MVLQAGGGVQARGQFPGQRRQRGVLDDAAQRVVPDVAYLVAGATTSDEGGLAAGAAWDAPCWSRQGEARREELRSFSVEFLHFNCYILA